jgi:hypothetical protein
VAATAPVPRKASSGTRDWWLRVVLLFQHPRAVFAALRDDSNEAAADRSEPVLAIVLLAGIALVLSTGTAGQLMDNQEYDALLVAVWAFIAGGMYAVFGYFAFGALLHGVLKAFRSHGSYRRTRHLVAFAAAPIALSLVLWPFRLALYGEDVFRTGGADAGTGTRLFEVLELAFVAWTVALLVIGVRAVHGWTWARAGSAVAVALGVPVLIGLAVGVT